MKPDYNKYLSKTTRKYVDDLITRSLVVSQPPSVDFIRFTNAQQTEGVNSKGQKVKVVGTKGQPTSGGTGYLVDSQSNSYFVVGPNPESVTTDGDLSKAYVLLQKKTGSYPTAQRSIYVQKGTSTTLYQLPVTFTTLGSYAVWASFSLTGKNILLTQGVDSSNSSATYKLAWQKTMGFGLSGSSVTGTTTIGTYETSWTFLPLPPTPGTGGGSGWTPVAPATVTTTYAIPSATNDSNVNIISPKSNMTSTGSIDHVSFFLTEVRSVQVFTNGSTFSIVDLTNQYRGRFQVLDVSGASPTVSTVTDWTSTDTVTSWNPSGPVISRNNTTGTRLSQSYLGIYRNGNTRAANYRYNSFPTLYWWDTTGYIDPIGAITVGTPWVFTDTAYITGTNPFDSTLVKATETGKYLSLVSSGHLTKYTATNTGYTTKQYNIASINTSLYFTNDWTIA